MQQNRQTIAPTGVPALLTAMAMLGLVVVWISPRLDYQIPMADRPIEVMVILLVAMGLVFLVLAHQILTKRFQTRLVLAGVAVGVLLRVAMMFSHPILETDFYRYLWDGGVAAQGINPYRPVPLDVFQYGGALAHLAVDSGPVWLRINHAELRTIYPPVAQGFFALSYGIAPWSLTAWRVILFVADLAVLGMLLLMLRRAGLAPALALLYWLNPLVLKEIHNAAHMDVLLAPFILGALLLAHRGRLTLAVLCLVVATGLKLWPVLLVPIVLMTATTSWNKRMLAGTLYAGLVALLHIPVMLAGLDQSSGFTAYASRWEMNSGLYMVMAEWGGRSLATVISVVLLGATILLVLRHPVRGIGDLAGRALVVIALLFLISPTQFPWYTLWFLPLLAIRPHMGLLLYALTLPLYYMRFRYSDMGLANAFDYGVVWVQHAPVLILLVAAKWKPGWMNAAPASFAGDQPGLPRLQEVG